MYSDFVMSNEDPSTLRNLEDFAGIASDWFWETDADHRFTYFSARMVEVTHIPPEEVLGHKRGRHPVLQDDKAAFDDHWDDLENHRPFRNFEYRIKRQMSDGYLWLRVSGDPVFDDNGTFEGYRGTGHDVTKEKEAMARLEALNAALTIHNQELDSLRRELELAAFEDPLTGLKNRRAFDVDIGQMLETRRPYAALLLIDLDRFKAINDTFGHPAGDMVLITVAARITETCCTEGDIYRMGGDEFAVIFPTCRTVETASRFAEDIIDALQAPIAFEGATLSVGASVGLALARDVPTSPHHLIAEADKMLYRAKSAGRNCVRHHENERRAGT